MPISEDIVGATLKVSLENVVVVSVIKDGVTETPFFFTVKE